MAPGLAFAFPGYGAAKFGGEGALAKWFLPGVFPRMIKKDLILLTGSSRTK
jgi:hypothetical protein